MVVLGPKLVDSNAEIRLQCGRTSDVEEQLSRDVIAAAATDNEQQKQHRQILLSSFK